MANTILIRRGSGTPTYSDFTQYELAYDYTNDKLYIRDGNAMVEIGGGGASTSGSNNQVLTDDGSGGINSESSLTFDGTQLTNTGKIKIASGSLGVHTNPLSDTGSIVATNDIIAGQGGGSVAMTINDGGGNANVTFNHRNKTPDQNGNSGRIEVNVDSSGGEYMAFEVVGSVSNGVSVNTNEKLRIDSAGADVTGALTATGKIQSTATGGFTIGNIAGEDRIQNSSNSFSFLTDGNAYAGMTFGTVTAGTWNGTAIASAYLDADTAHLSTNQTFTGTKTFQTVVKLQSELDFTGNGNKIIDVETLENSNSFRIRNHNPLGNVFHDALKLVGNGGAHLYYNNSKKLETTNTGATVSGNITVTGTVDGRDVASDGSKLDGIESGATAGGTTNASDLSSGTIPSARIHRPESGDWFDGTPVVGSDGVMEIGRYIDFHNTDTTTNDYDVRLDNSGSNQLDIQTGVGYIRLGPQNTSWSHIYTDRQGHLFNVNPTSLDGKFQSYSGVDLNLRRSQGDTDRLLIASGIATFSQSLHIEKGLSVDPKTHSLNSDARYHLNVLSHRDNTSRSGAFIIDTDIARTSNRMSVIHVHGHGYGQHAVIDFKVCFYPYSGQNGPDGNSGNIINYSLTDNGNDGRPKFLGINSSGNVAIAIDDYDGSAKYFWHFQVDWYNGTSAVQTPTWSISNSTTDGFGWIQKHTLLPPIHQTRTGANSYTAKVNGKLGVGVEPSAKLHISESGGSTDDAFIVNPTNGGNRTMTIDGEKINVTYTNNGGAGPSLVLQDNGGNVGVGTSSPTKKLHVEGTTRFNGDSIFGPNNNNSKAFIRANNGYSAHDTPDYTWYYNDTCGIFHPAGNVIGFSASGEKVKIGTYGLYSASTTYIAHGGSDYTPNISFLGGSNTPGSNAYENAGIGYYDNSGTGSMKFFGNRSTMSWFFTDSDETLFNMASDGTFHAEADVVAYSQTTNSDRKLKENINPIQYGLKEVLEINPVKYKWIEKRGGKEDIGVIAQDIEKIIPEIVQENKALNSNEMIKSVDYGKMVAVLIKAVQEQQQQINELKEKLNG